MKHLACALQDWLADNSQQLFQKRDLGKESASDQALTVISTKLVALAHILQSYPSDCKGQFLGKITACFPEGHPTHSCYLSRFS